MTTVPKLIIDDKPAVMRLVTPLEDFDGLDSRLAIVLITKTGDACPNAHGIDLAENSSGACAEDVKGTCVNISINDDGSCLGGLDESFERDTCSKELTVEEHHLGRRR